MGMYHDEYALDMYNEQRRIQIFSYMENIESKMVSFDKTKLAEFKIAFNEAKKQNEHYFMFDGHEWFLGYAKYAIEFLENKFNQKNLTDDGTENSKTNY